MLIEVGDTHIAQVRKTPFTVDISTWPEASLRKVFEYGIQQLLNDAAAPAKTPAEIAPLVEKRIVNLANGVLRATRIGGGDPVAREALRIATGMVAAALAKAGKKADAKQIRTLADALIGKRPDITATAAANVAATASLDVEVDIDL